MFTKITSFKRKSSKRASTIRRVLLNDSLKVKQLQSTEYNFELNNDLQKSSNLILVNVNQLQGSSAVYFKIQSLSKVLWYLGNDELFFII